MMLKTISSAAAITLVAGFASAQVIAFQSFEEADGSLIDGTFAQANTDARDGSGNNLMPGDVVPLLDSSGNLVNWTRTGDLATSEMSFNTSWIFSDPENVFTGLDGLSTNTFIGYTSFSPESQNAGSGFGPDGLPDSGDEIWPDGNRGFQMQSTSGGLMQSVFETVNFDGDTWEFSIDVAFQTGNFEFQQGNRDFIDISIDVDGGQTIEVLSLDGTEINDAGLNTREFSEYSVDLSGFTEATLVVTWQGFESIWYDDIVFQVPAPGSAVLFGAAGVAAFRRRRA